MRNQNYGFFSFSFSMASITKFSVSTSNELVGSSKINNSEFLNKALAIPIL